MTCFWIDLPSSFYLSFLNYFRNSFVLLILTSYVVFYSYCCHYLCHHVCLKNSLVVPLLLVEDVCEQELPQLQLRYLGAGQHIGVLPVVEVDHVDES